MTPMLGTNIKDCPPGILKGKTWRVTEKIDGVRRLFYKSKTGLVSAYSRTGKQDLWLSHITDYLSSPWFPCDRVYDCELVDKHLYLAKVDSFILRAETTSKANQQYKDNKQDLIAICFDMYQPGSDASSYDRMLELTMTLGHKSAESPIMLVPCYGEIEGEDSLYLTEWLDEVYKRKGEGLMLLDLSSMYIPGRSRALIKIKRAEEFIGTIVDITMSSIGTKIEGGISSLICRVEGCTLPVHVGTGYSMEERLYLAKRVKELLGRQIEIEAFSKTRDAQGNISLSMPVFKQLL